MKVEVSHENSNHSNYEPCLDTSLCWYDEVVGFLDEMSRKLFRTVVSFRWYDEVARFFVKLIMHFIPDSSGRRPESRHNGF